MTTEEKSIRHLEVFRPQIESISKRGIILIVVLCLFIAAGIYALYIQVTKGHIVTGMRDNVVWGLYIVNFIFFIGISYAGALISGILHLLRVPWRTPIIRMAEMITVISTLIGPAYILLCIGRLDRIQNLLLFGRIQSPIIWDVIAITTYLSGSIIFLYLAMIRDLALLRDNPVRKATWRNPIYRFMAIRYYDSPRQRELLNVMTDLLSIIIIPLAILVHSVLAWIFGMTLRPGWHSTIFAPYFVIAAVYSGTGVLIMVMWVFRRVYHLESYITKVHFNYLGIIMIVLGALYGYFTFSEYLTSWYGSIKWDMEVLYRLFNPNQYWLEFVFAVFIGVLLPIIIVTVPRFRNINSIAFAGLIAVMALWVKRYLIIIPTLESPLLPIHDLRPEFSHYFPTWVEWTLTLAGVALFILLFYLFSKFIPIIPVSRTAEEKDYNHLRKKVFERQVRRIVRIKKNGTVAAGILLILMIVVPAYTLAQDDQDSVRTVLKLDYFCKDGNRTLSAVLKAKKEGIYTPVEGMKISFEYLKDGQSTLLGSGETDMKGIASLPVPEEVFQTSAGEYPFKASFPGAGNFRASESSVTVRSGSMSMSFSQVEGKRMINLVATGQGDKNLTTPLDGLDVQFYVPRTFSLLKVGQATLKAGAASLEFPVTIPGDEFGNITILARIEDNETYGNIEASGRINWGKPVMPEKPVRRGLGDTDAPLWMVYTLIVLLSLVWFHYMYIIFTVFRIRYMGRRRTVEADRN